MGWIIRGVTWGISALSTSDTFIHATPTEVDHTPAGVPTATTHESAL